MPPDSLPEVAAAGVRLATLRALRDVLATTIGATEQARDVAALSRQLMLALEEIETLEKAAPEQEGTALDELKRRRQEKGARPTRASSS